MRPRIAGRVQLQVTSTHGRMQSHCQPCTLPPACPALTESLSGPGTGQTSTTRTLPARVPLSAFQNTTQPYLGIRLSCTQHRPPAPLPSPPRTPSTSSVPEKEM